MQGNLQILGGLQAQLQASTDALNQAEQQNLYLRSLLAQYQAAPTLHGKEDAAGNPVTPLTPDEQLEALKAQLGLFKRKVYPALSRHHSSKRPDCATGVPEGQGFRW